MSIALPIAQTKYAEITAILIATKKAFLIAFPFHPAIRQRETMPKKIARNRAAISGNNAIRAIILIAKIRILSGLIFIGRCLQGKIAEQISFQPE
jgi:hypothetical protein